MAPNNLTAAITTAATAVNTFSVPGSCNLDPWLVFLVVFVSFWALAFLLAITWWMAQAQLLVRFKRLPGEKVHDAVQELYASRFGDIPV